MGGTDRCVIDVRPLNRWRRRFGHAEHKTLSVRHTCFNDCGKLLLCFHTLGNDLGTHPLAEPYSVEHEEKSAVAGAHSIDQLSVKLDDLRCEFRKHRKIGV